MLPRLQPKFMQLKATCVAMTFYAPRNRGKEEARRWCQILARDIRSRSRSRFKFNHFMQASCPSALMPYLSCEIAHCPVPILEPRQKKCEVAVNLHLNSQRWPRPVGGSAASDTSYQFTCFSYLVIQIHAQQISSCDDTSNAVVSIEHYKVAQSH